MPISLRAAVLAGALLGASQPAFGQELTLDAAIAKAAEATPMLRASEASIAAARAGRRQADVRPNPSITVEGENFVGGGRYGVFAQAEITGTYNQPIERGGKRAARVTLAEREIGVAEALARVARLELASAVQRAFVDIVIADYVAQIAASRLGTELEMQREALRRVRGYKDPLFVETRAAARVAQAQIGVAAATTRQRAARDALAAFWGGTGDALVVKGDLLAGVPAASKIAAADDALAEATTARAAAAITVEQTRRVQDYTISGGARFLRGTNDIAAVTGITIPLGRFDRNQGAIERAQAERLRIELTAEANRLDRLRRLAALGTDAAAARTQAQAIVTEVYPRTTKALQQVRVGYARGGFSFGDMQDAADAILRAQDEWLEAITKYRDLEIDIDRLTGRFDVAQPLETRP